MARNGSGTYSLPEADFVYDTVIDEAAVNNNFGDIADALTASLAKDGQTNPTANLPMANYRHTGVGNASARTDYAAAGQVQDGAFIWCGTAGGTADALTLTPSPAITAYATGQVFRFKAGASDNTGATTVAISGLTTKAIQLNDAALAAEDIVASKYYSIIYDGTAFQLTRLSPATRAGQVLVSGDDTTPRYLEDALVAGDNVTLTVNNDGADETMTISVASVFSGITGAIVFPRGI